MRVLTLPAFMAQTPQPIEGPTTLDNARYRLRWHWSPLAGLGSGAWLVDLYSAAGDVLAPSVPAIITGDLWGSYKDDTRVPQGFLEIKRVSGEGDPGPGDLGSAVEISYTRA